MIGVDVDLPRADADEMVVGVDDSETRGVDVAVNGADYTHGFLLQTGFFEQVMATAGDG